MATVSQQPEQSTAEESQTDRWSLKCWSWCVKFWPYLCAPVVGIVFVGFALTIAIVFMGYGNKYRQRNRHYRFECPNINGIKPRDDNAKISSTQKYPFLGALLSQKPYMFLCTVVILTNKYLLTRANCFMANFQNLTVRVGSDVWNSDGSQYSVQAFIINQEFNGVNMENNVALVRVTKSIIMKKNVKPVEMSISAYARKRNGIALGWNYWAVRGHQNVRLVEQELVIWKAGSCREHLGSGNETGPKFICASLSSALCNLDATGPLIVNGKLVGFWSWGLSCPEVPSIFTNLYYCSKWISDKIGA